MDKISKAEEKRTASTPRLAWQIREHQNRNIARAAGATHRDVLDHSKFYKMLHGSWSAAFLRDGNMGQWYYYGPDKPTAARPLGE